MMDSQGGRDTEYFEADPSGMNIGIGIRNLKKVSMYMQPHSDYIFPPPQNISHPVLQGDKQQVQGVKAK